MQRLFEPCEVDAGEREPVRVRHGGRTYAVDDVLDRWVLESRWWAPARHERRIYFRLRTEKGVALDVYRSGSTWVLARILD